MRFAGAAAVSVLVVCAGGTLRVARGQQPAGVIRPVVATVDVSAGPLGPKTPAKAWMPSRVAGHLADRLQALHDTALHDTALHDTGLHNTAASPTSNLAEIASRTPQPDASTAKLKPAASTPAATDQPGQPQPARLSPQGNSSAPPPTEPPAAPRRNPLVGDRPSFGIANPLRDAR